jgi:hypothetical protein
VTSFRNAVTLLYFRFGEHTARYGYRWRHPFQPKFIDNLWTALFGGSVKSVWRESIQPGSREIPKNANFSFEFNA